MVAVPLPLSVKVMPVGQGTGLGEGRGRVPVVVTVKLKAAPTIEVAEAALVMVGRHVLGQGAGCRAGHAVQLESWPS